MCVAPGGRHRRDVSSPWIRRYIALRALVPEPGADHHVEVSSGELPPCGLYRTVLPVGSIEAGRLVYLHNHGNPGPGLYHPDRWTHNRAHFAANGMTVPDNFDPKALHALPPEGFYRVTKS